AAQWRTPTAPPPVRLVPTRSPPAPPPLRRTGPGAAAAPPPQLRQSRRLMRHIPQETQVLERAADTLLSPHVRHRVVLPAKEEHPQRKQPEYRSSTCHP